MVRRPTVKLRDFYEETEPVAWPFVFMVLGLLGLMAYWWLTDSPPPG